MMFHTCTVITIKGYLSRESLLPLIFHVLKSFSIIIYKNNDNSNTFIIYVLYNYPLCVIYIIFYIFHLVIILNYNFHIIIWITQLIFLFHEIIFTLTHYTFSLTHTISQTHTLLINPMKWLNFM